MSEELFEKYFREELTPGEAAGLKSLLESGLEAQKRFTDFLQERSLLIRVCGRKREEARAPASSAARRRPSVRRPTPSVAWWIGLVAAACLAVVTGTVLYNMREAGRMPEKILARIETFGGAVRVTRQGSVVTVEAGLVLVSGDHVATGAGESCVIRYEGEDTRVTVGRVSELRVGEDAEGKHIGLRKGEIDLDAAPQPLGKPMTITTRHARVEIMGTRLTVCADDTSTRVDVVSGLVQVTDLADGAVSRLAAGDHLTVGVPAIAAEAAAPAGGAKYRDGEIVFQDDFSTGLGKWTRVMGRTQYHFEPLTGEDLKRVRVETRKRAGRETSCVMIDTKGLANVGIGIQMPSIGEEAWSMEVEYKVEEEYEDGFGAFIHCHGLEWLVKPIRTVFSKRELTQSQIGQWHSTRTEYVSRTDETGRKVIETRVFFVRNKCGAHEIYPDSGERRLLIGVLNGRTAIDRVAVWRMERVR